ncbi:DUF2946 family protein [Sphingomonas sp.]|uniref:DUF2946 family protein n=1 Tax=Sphingomonas sp. TaxID=28214 RepID=UPI0035BBE374
MTGLRQYLLCHRALAASLVALALLMKVLVPTGYMLGTSTGSITVELCSGYGPAKMTMPGMAHHGGDKSDHGKAEQPCAFSGLSAPSLAATDPILLALALAFIIATAFRAPTPVLVQARAFLRPPTTGPPVHS